MDPANKNNTWSIIIVIAILGIGYALSREKAHNLEKYAVYTIGTVTGIKDWGRGGAQHVFYTFKVDTVTYKGHMPVRFCFECGDSCCATGKKVKVRYVAADPENNGLVH